MDELVKAQNDIVTTSDETPAEPILHGKEWLVTEDLPNLTVRQIVNQVLQRVSLGNVISKIERGSEYVVQVPLKFKEAFEKGEVFISQNKDTLQLRPQLSKYNSEGKYEFVGPMDMIERKTFAGDPLHSIADRYQNMAMQQQLNQISELLEMANETVQRIEQGQYADRKGLLVAGKNMICRALSDPEHIDFDELKKGREQLELGRSQFGETIITLASNFKKISKHKIIRFFQLFPHGNYYDLLDEDYKRIEECYECFFQGTRMLAASYAICGDTANASLVFDQANATIAKIDFDRVKGISYIHPKEKDWIFDTATQYIDNSKVACLEDAKKYELISVKVSGQELLEAYEHGEEQRIQEETAE